MDIAEFINNSKQCRPPKSEPYTAILGLKPSQGARSPKLWNAAFEFGGLSTRMWPLDICEENLAPAIATLRQDPGFIGGAVAVPFKTKIVELLDDIDSEARAIGAVNVIYRDRTRLIGTNTDGAAGLAALEARIGSLRGIRGVLLGAGGAGTAVAVYLAQAIGRNGSLTLANRSQLAAETLVARIKDFTAVKASSLANVGNACLDADLIVNCTSVGMELWRTSAQGTEYLRPFSPLGLLPPPQPVLENDRKGFIKIAAEAMFKNHGLSLKILSAAKNPFVYDIVYQPDKSVLLEMSEWCGYKTLNGSPMNLTQAVLAYSRVVAAAGLPELNAAELETIMSAAAVRG